ncbi:MULTISPECIES: S9 family peptidase [Anaeromyxobacter]|uniref:S9 family peptidase n=1 Tax=Anaeromyxobacter TaxID=161492 RepID=UPI001F59678A|nr:MULTISPECIES: S9 family peptidase [unclassified Anaeromyxobacter]
MTRRLASKLLLAVTVATLGCAGTRRDGAAAAAAPGKAGAPAAAAARREGLPPIVDRELIFGDPEISAAQLSPDGAWIAFLKPLDGTRNVWVKPVDAPFEQAKPVTADQARPIPAYFWSWDSRFILFVQDHAGDENYNVYAVDPRAAPAPGAKVPPARGLTDLKGVRAEIYEVPKARPGVVYVGLNDRDARWHDLYEVEIATGKRTLLRRNEQRFVSWTFDLSGRLRLGTRVTERGDTEILRVDPAGMQKVYGCTVLEDCSAARFDPDGRVYLVTNGGAGDLLRLSLLDVQTGVEEVLASDPEKRVDLKAPVFSEATDRLVGAVYDDERLRFRWSDPGYQADHAALQARFPDRDVLIQSTTRDDRRWLVSVTADVEPGEVYLFDRTTKAVTKQYRLRERLPRQDLAHMQPIRYPSSDGLEIPAFLTLPAGVPAKALPLVVFPHGGPWWRDSWRCHPFAQFLANRGYAVLQPNFRGSTGYGKRFLDAGNLQWGDKMQDDLTWGVRYLVAQGVVDPRRVGIMGGSYGGYATLAGVTFTPDLYAAAVAIVAPSSLITLLETIPPYWEAGRIVFHTRMGNPTTPEGRAQLERQSPLNHVAAIRTPLQIVQGANDPRVKRSESDQIVVALRERGFPVEYLVAPDEGHGFQRPVNNMAAFASAEKFLAKHLGGRFQEDMPPAVAQRLREITVDPASVAAPQRAAPAAAPPR